MPGEQPANGVHHALLPVNRPPLAQQAKQVGEQESVAISPAFAALDPQEYKPAVNIADLERGHRGGT